jgi:hypothetical protein
MAVHIFLARIDGISASATGGTLRVRDVLQLSG